MNFRLCFLVHVVLSGREAQARRHEMKWRGGVVPKMRWGLLFVKKVDLIPPQNETKLNQTLLLFYILLIWGGCIRTQRTPLPTGMSGHYEIAT